MMRADAGARLVRNPEFRLERGPDGWAFVHATGFRVATDLLGRLAWDALPGSEAAIERKIRTRLVVPRHALRTFLEVVRSSGLARAEDAEEAPPILSGEAGAAPPGESADLVSVIVTTYNGTAHLDDCFGSIARQTYSRFEVIAVDNGSTDGTVERLRTAYPWVKIVETGRNVHYAGGVNAGAAAAGGEYLFVLNQDTELDPRCIERLHRRAAADGTIGAVAPLMRFHQLRGVVNGIGNEIWPHGWGTDIYIGHVDIGQLGGVDELPSICFGAAFLRRDAFEAVGPLDRAYGSFYEDVDWCFRCWFSGRRIVGEPGAVVYHKFGGSYGGRTKLRFVVRNRQRLVLKLFQGKVRLGVLKRYLKEDIRSVLSLMKHRRWASAGAYAEAYLSLVLRTPGTLAARRKVMRTKGRGIRELDVFRRNIEFYDCLSPRGHPRLDASTLLGYYRWIGADRAD